jgi:hypothetical protein
MVADVYLVSTLGNPDDLGAMNAVVLILPLLNPDFWLRPTNPKCQAYVCFSIVRIEPEAHIGV